MKKLRRLLVVVQHPTIYLRRTMIHSHVRVG